MKRKTIRLLTLLIIIIIFVSCSSLNINKNYAYILSEMIYEDSNGKNRIGKLEYDMNGNISKLIVNEINGNYFHTITYEYDENNNMINEYEETSEGYYYTITYEYDENNNMISEYEETSTGNYYTITYEYDENNNMISEERKEFRKNSEITFHQFITYEYDNTNTLVKKYKKNIINNDVETFYYYIFKYNEEGYLIKEYGYNEESSEPYLITRYMYNDNNKLINKTIIHSDKGKIQEEINEYDKNGNLKQQYCFFKIFTYIFEARVTFKYKKISQENFNNNIETEDYLKLLFNP